MGESKFPERCPQVPGAHTGRAPPPPEAPVEGIRREVLPAVRQQLVVLQEALPLGDKTKWGPSQQESS